jgi:hypothetical protein
LPLSWNFNGTALGEAPNERDQYFVVLHEGEWKNISLAHILWKEWTHEPSAINLLSLW